MTPRFPVGLLAAVAIAGCGGNDGGPTPPHAGDLVVSYFPGGSQPGAIMLTISGGPVESVLALPATAVQVSFNLVAPGTTRVLVTGALVTGDLFTIRVADTALATRYVARIDQVADNVTFALVDPLNHTFTVHH